MFKDYITYMVWLQKEPDLGRTSTAHIYTVHPIYCLYTVRTPSLIPIYSQSVNHLSCPCSVSTPPLWPVTSETITSRGHVQPKHHLSCPYPVIMPPKALCPCSVSIPSFLPLRPCTISTPHILSKYPDSTLSLQPMSSLYAISTTNVKTVPYCIQPISSHKHLYNPCSEIMPS